MRPCRCRASHPRRRIVITGGPGAGKTALLELVQQSFCQHVRVLGESASILFGGGFPRSSSPAGRRAAQRAIFHVQRELEALAAEPPGAAAVLCDRGTVDGSAYWPGRPDAFFRALGTTRDAELARYDAVIHLRVPPHPAYGLLTNPLRIESAKEAARIDERIHRAWLGHPRLHTVEASADFLVKIDEALETLRAELPRCCRDHRRALSPKAGGGTPVAVGEVVRPRARTGGVR